MNDAKAKRFELVLLKNRIYTGQLIWNKKHYDKNQKTKKHFKYIKNDPAKVIISQGKHQPIIALEDFEKVQNLLATKKPTWRPRVKNQEYLLSGLLSCAKCNSRYCGNLSIANHRTGVKKHWYRCSGPLSHGIRCKNRAIKASEVEVWADGIVGRLVESEGFKDD